MVRHPKGNDPRNTGTNDDLAAAGSVSYPEVARGNAARMDLGMLGIVAASLLIGGVTWFGLTQQKKNETTPPAAAPVAAMPQPLRPAPEPEPEPVQRSALSRLRIPHPTRSLHPTRAEESQPGGNVLIVDNSTPKSADDKTGKGGKPGDDKNSMLSSNDKFAASLSGNIGKATRIAAPSMTVPQGAVIPAVLETAVNTDLPGFTRAIVSRDVLSFDGANVLIPRGARLIGQYKSGLTSGVTRVFIIWTRLIRPDGLSVTLGSPGMDGKGQTGLSGEVSTHFLKRFGAAMLLSVVSGVSSLGSGSTIVIGSSSAQSAASEALSSDTKIPPTIKVAQGTAIQVFVAQDLDFSEVE